MGIIFNEIVIDKSVFRMVLFIHVKYFNLKKVPLFLSLVLTRLEQIRNGQTNLPSYFV